MNKLLVVFILSFCFLSCVPVKKHSTDEQFTSFIEQEVTTAQAQKRVYHFKVNAIPSNSTIKVMNITPKYRHNMNLSSGKYDILVQKKGYKSNRKWIEIKDRDVTINVTLQKVTKSRQSSTKKVTKSRQKSSTKYGTGRHQKKASKSGCSPRKSCRTVASCKEAYYHLKTCGNKRLDRDKDGVPCESICSGG